MTFNIIKESINIFKYNLRTIIKYEAVYKALLSLILLPIAVFLFNFTMKVTGYNYLTLENIFSFLTNPFSIFLLLIIIAFLTFLSLFDISTHIIIYDESFHKNKIGLTNVVKISFKRCMRLLRPSNIGISLLLLLFIPLLNLGIGSNVVTSLKIPDFVIGYIRNNTLYLIALIIFYLIMLVLSIKWLYSLHYMVLENANFDSAKKKSNKLIAKNKIKDTLCLILLGFFESFIHVIIIIIGVSIITFLNNIFIRNTYLKSLFISTIWLYSMFCLLILTTFFNSVSYAFLSALFYKNKIIKNENIKLNTYKSVYKDKKSNAFIHNMIIAMIFLGVLGFGLFSYQVMRGKTNFNIESFKEMEITAHRGSSIDYPENTMLAFKKAKEEGTDWIELDIAMTKDEKIIVIHDTNLSRLAGINKNVNELTYDEISKIDIGSHKDKKYKGEKIPLLEEVLAFAKIGNIRLNIEFKPLGNEKDFERKVIELIKNYGMEDECVLTSQTYNVLKNIKRVDKSFKTVYVMTIALGNFILLEDADAFSIEEFYVTKKLVNEVHNAGKEFYAWTINDESNINRMISYNVDNIITDKVSLAKEVVMKNKNSDFINSLIKYAQMQK